MRTSPPRSFGSRKHGRPGTDDNLRDKGGYYGPPSQANYHDRGRPTSSVEDNYQDRYDDDGRNAHSRKKSRASHAEMKDKEPMKREWPPPFESSGASYVFDARSGFFYEPASDFFYDPKTKLYYGNKKRQYFQFVVDSMPPFRAIGNDQAKGQGQVGEMNRSETVASPGDSMGNGTVVNQVELEKSISSQTTLDKVEPKSKIAICLKTIVLPQKDPADTIEKNKLKEKNLILKRQESSQSGAEVVPTAVLPQSHKQHEKDMNKWSERVKEMRSEEAPPTNVVASETPPDSTPTHRTVNMTAFGQPICVLCKRKFANLDKLQQHEKLSALHKENLAKAMADVKATSTEEPSTEVTYRDRSKERRMLYGDIGPLASSGNASHADALLAQVNANRTSSISKATEVLRPEETLGNTNIGNKLLQKLGWKSGDTLGRKQDESNGIQSTGNDVARCLKNDWERIESLAQGGGGSAQQYR